MADSDSELDDYTETNVLLGYPEEESKGDDISHLGGAPTWLHPSSPADARLAKCGSCNKLMTLLLQLNGAVPESPHDRMFYVWGCRAKTCRRKPNTVRAIRGVKVVHSHEKEKKENKKEEDVPTTSSSSAPSPPPPTPATPMQNAGGLLFGSGTAKLGSAPANPFSSGGTVNPFSSTPAPASGFVNPFSSNPTPAPAPAPKPAPAPPKATPETITKTFSSALSFNLPAPEPVEPLLFGPAEPWPESLPKFPHFYLDAELETLEPEKPVVDQKVQIEEMDTSGGGVEGKDVAADGTLDKVFQRFADRVAQNPDQVLRYERGGLPLLYSADDAVGKLLKGVEEGKQVGRRLPPCGNCGKRERCFEFQLMPTAISVLEGDEVGFDGMEWGTIIVGTCLCVPRSLDANGVGWVEEWVGVQWEGQR